MFDHQCHISLNSVSSSSPKCCQPIKLQDSLKCNISRKKWIMNFTFDMSINILPFWVCVTRHAQSTQNKFAYFCSISRKAWRMKLLFCLQIKVKVFSKWYYLFRCVCPGMSKLRKITDSLILCNILRKKWVMKLIFCMQISMKACYKLILWLWWRWSSIPNSPQNRKFVMSLQYLEKEVDFTLWASMSPIRW